MKEWMARVAQQYFGINHQGLLYNLKMMPDGFLKTEGENKKEKLKNRKTNLQILFTSILIISKHNSRDVKAMKIIQALTDKKVLKKELI